jgi:hypothetical protein
MNWEGLEVKLGVWAEELLAGTPTPHAAVVPELLRQVVLKGGVVMLDVLLTLLPLTYQIVDWDNYAMQVKGNQREVISKKTGKVREVYNRRQCP